MEFLPVDLLLLLFRCLDTRQLLLARGVCRRWRDLALHPHAWKHRSVQVARRRDVPLQIAVLRLAPCLHNLSFKGVSLERMMRATSDEWGDMGRLSIGTACAVRGLDLAVNVDCGRVAKIIRNQATLPSSRLRRLCLSSWPVTCGEDALLQVIRALAGATCLLELDVYKGSTRVKWPASAFLPSRTASRRVAFLQKLTFRSLSQSPDPLLEFLLETHASTMKAVTLLWNVPSECAVFRLLARCQKLRELQCPLSDHMTELASSRSLADLSLYSSDWHHSGATTLPESSVLNFFRGATRLRHLSFESIHNEVMPLLAALSSSGQSSLETLALRAGPMPDHRDWDRLGAALPGLPRLRSLWVTTTPPASLLRAVSPIATPNLRLLHVGKTAVPCAWENIYCGEELQLGSEYVAELRAAMRRVPGLHVSGLELVQRYCGNMDGGKCVCWRSPQGLANVPVWREFGLYSHEDRQPCDLHDAHRVWVRLD